MVEVPCPPPHHAQYRCEVCDKFHGFVRKPENERIPRRLGSHRELASDAHACFACGLTRQELKALGRWITGHHVFEHQRPEVQAAPLRDDGSWPLCNACHEWIHVLRKHFGNPKGPPLPPANQEHRP